MDNRTKLLEICAELFEVPLDSLSEETTQDSIENWDSLGMVNLIAEVEAAFGVKFALLEIAEFRTIGIIKDTLAAKGVVF